MFDAKKLKERRLEKGLTQADVYEDLKISRKTYSSWENGLAEPHEKNLRRLAKRLSVKEDYFINKDSALYTYPLLTPPHQKKVDQLASQLLEQQQKVVSLTAYKVLSIELAAGYREAEGLRLESINPDYDDLFAPYEDEPKIVGIVVGHFLPLEV